MAMLRMTFVVVAAVSLAAGARAERLRDCLWISGDETGHLDGPGNKWGLPPATEYYHQVRGCIDFGIASLHCGMFGHPDKALRDSFSGLDRVDIKKVDADPNGPSCPFSG